MPVIEISLNDLSNLIGRKIAPAELEDDVLFVKGELEEINKDTAKIEIKDTNRPDLWSVEGIARELKGAYRIEVGLPKYEVKDSDVVLNVEKKVEKVRPKIVAAIVKNVKLSDKAIEQLIQLQEKVAMTYGRKREQAAIGVYDYDKIKSPIRFTTVKPNAIKFVPLDFQKAMTPIQILKTHPKGQEYGHLISEAKEYPLLIDASANVLSMPPIINSSLTGRITEKTKNIFIEVTGFNLKIINTALNVMVAALAYRNGSIENVKVVYGNKKIKTPALKPQQFLLNPENCRNVLGLKISNKEMIKLLKEARYDAVESGKKIKVSYPAYRADIMHERDVIEDVAISFGYNDFEPAYPKLATVGSSSNLEVFSDKIRELMMGFGLQEIMTFTLTNYDSQYKNMRYEKEQCAEIANPISERFCILRSWLLPSLMEFLSRNTHVDYPQKIFEVGDVVWIDEKAETKTKDVKTLACAIASHTSSYTDIKSIIDRLAASLGSEFKIKEMECHSFIEGRAAEILLNGNSIGYAGEIHPQVLNNWGIEVPVVVLEIQIEKLKQ